MLKIKGTREELVQKIADNVSQEVRCAFLTRSPNYYGEEVSISINDLIANAVTRGVITGIETLLDNQYTDSDFENDLGLTAE